MAHLQTTAPIAGAVSLVVMTTIASSASGFAPVAQPPALVKAANLRGSLGVATPSDSSALRWRYEVPLGATPDSSLPSDVSVRISYLIVPGT